MMKLRLEFPNSFPVESSSRSVKTEEPIFLTRDGVSGYVHIDSAGNIPTLTGSVVEIRLLGKHILFRPKLTIDNVQGHVKTSMVWAESSILIPEGNSFAFKKTVRKPEPACATNA